MSAELPATAWNTAKVSPSRVLIVDDSVVARTVLERIIVEHPGFVVAHKTNNAQQALAFLAHNRVDIILLDVEMPGQSGLVALPAILKAGINAKVIILSGNCDEGSAAAVEALALGASDIMSKPGSGSFCKQFSGTLLARISRIAGRDEVANSFGPSIHLRSAAPHRPLACLGVGASTGGIHALGQLFDGLAKPLGVPILLTQHLPPSFIPYFATQMTRITTLPVRIAQQGDVLKPDHIYIAPGEANLGCRKSLNGQVTVALSTDRAPLGSLPAVDPMFTAMAQCYGSGSAGIVLTGMGRDGTEGARQIVGAGGWVVAQDQSSSVVWGMPGSVARAGLATALLSPEKIMTFAAKYIAVAA